MIVAISQSDLAIGKQMISALKQKGESLETMNVFAFLKDQGWERNEAVKNLVKDNGDAFPYLTHFYAYHQVEKEKEENKVAYEERVYKEEEQQIAELEEELAGLEVV